MTGYSVIDKEILKELKELNKTLKKFMYMFDKCFYDVDEDEDDR